MSHFVTRRSWMQTTGLAATGTALGGLTLPELLPAETAQSAAALQPAPFRHRGYLGWITDLASTPDASAAWPSMRLDGRLLEDYRQSFSLMRDLGMNEISIWGLYVSKAWPEKISYAVLPDRAVQAAKLIEEAHRHGLAVLSGLGVYSWGFEEIIKSYPEVSRGSAQVMCAHEPKAWTWMQKVIDFMFKRFDIDGVSMQSADQGRCACTQCKTLSDPEYHALLNVRVADYIRGQWPKKTIGVNSWGLRFGDPASLPSLMKIGEKVDYIIDVNNSAQWGGRDGRRKLIQSLRCDFGTLGGPQTEPPQHWERDRWFLPTLRRNASHLRQLAEDGGRACEYFFHIRANPGDDVSLRAAGRMLHDPGAPWEKHARAAVEAVFGATQTMAQDDILAFLLRAEDAYFQHLPPEICGTISLEPLVSNRPGPPVYLSERLNAAQRRDYLASVQVLQMEAGKLAGSTEKPETMRLAARCLVSVEKDLRALA